MHKSQTGTTENLAKEVKTKQNKVCCKNNNLVTPQNAVLRALSWFFN